jgi:hypothetical protein
MVIVASFTRYDVRTDRMVQPNYKMIGQQGQAIYKPRWDNGGIIRRAC